MDFKGTEAASIQNLSHPTHTLPPPHKHTHALPPTYLLHTSPPHTKQSLLIVVPILSTCNKSREKTNQSGGSGGIIRSKSSRLIIVYRLQCANMNTNMFFFLASLLSVSNLYSSRRLCASGTSVPCF